MHKASRIPVKPIFVDRSGRRRRLLKLTGAIIGGLLVVALGLLGAAVSGASPLRMPGFPDAGTNAEGATTTPAVTPGTTPPGPGPTSGQIVRQDPATPIVTATTTAAINVTATKPGRNPTHPVHPTPTKTK
jgi:hypothetical protein